MLDIKQTETAKGSYSNRAKNYFFIKKDIDYIKIYFNDILYLKAAGNSTEIYTKSGQYIITTNLAGLLKKLDNKDFVKANRSNVVNIEAIEKFNSDTVYIPSQNTLVEIKLTDTYRQNLMEKLKIIRTK